MIALKDDSSYLATLSKSIIIHLSEFYEKLTYIRISAKTGQGIAEVVKHIKMINWILYLIHV